MAVASAHALVAGLTGAAVLAGLDLDGMQRAVVAVAAVVGAAGNAAANVRIRILFTHGNNLLAMLVAWDSYSLPAGGGKNPHKTFNI